MEKNMGPISKIFYSWLTPIMWKAYRHGLNADDLGDIPEFLKSSHTSIRLQQIWDEELKKKGARDASLKKCIFLFIKRNLLLSSFVLVISFIFSFLGPAYLIRAILVYISTDDKRLEWGIGLAIGLAVAELCRSFTLGLGWYFLNQTAILMRSGVLSMVFRKMLRFKTLGSKSTGELINLFAADGARLYYAGLISGLVLPVPAILLGGCIYIWILLGPIGLTGAATFILFYPFQGIISKLTQHFWHKCINITDSRIKQMVEVITFIKFIKMYAWERPFADSILGTRKKERKTLEKAAYVQSLSTSMVPTVPIFAAVITIMSYKLMGHDLTIVQAFTLLPVLNLMSVTIGLLPHCVRSLSEFSIAVKRLKTVLLMEEVPDHQDGDIGVAVMIKELTCSWNEEIADPTPKRSKANGKEEQNTDGCSNKDVAPMQLTGIDIDMHKGQLIGICGLVGSGKTSLLSSILGKMHQKSGFVKVNGRVLYAPQQAWIFSGTVKDNVIFNKEYNKEKYEEVVSLCCLDEDIRNFPNGSETEIGERGINLSGGQKQRLSIARLLYQDGDIYLLDDPLSAVDKTVGRSIFTNIIKRALRGKTVLLVTHQVQYLTECDAVLVVHDGRIVGQGHHNVLKDECEQYRLLLNTSVETHDPDKDVAAADIADVDLDDQNIVTVDEGNNMDNSNGKLVDEEEKREGAISYKTYHYYVKSAGGYIVAFFVVLIFFINVGCSGFSNWWLSYWLSQGNSTNGESITAHENLNTYLLVYCMTPVAMLVTSFFKGLVFTKITLRATSKMHDRMFHNILRKPMEFFDTTPSGRIINRFSNDLSQADILLPVMAEQTLQNICLIFISIGIIISVFPWFTVAIVPLFVVFIFFQRFFRVGVRDLHRLNNIAMSPLYSELAEFLDGLSTIQAFKQTDVTIQRFCKTMDKASLPTYLSENAMRWLALRLDFITVVITLTTSLLVVLAHEHISPAYSGLALTYALQITGLFQLTIRLSCETESNFVAIERILQYSKEKKASRNILTDCCNMIAKKDPEAHAMDPIQPARGVVQFDNVVMKYREQTPVILKQVTFNCESNEKIGIVGRTGSGKSSLAVSLLRLVELESGTITIDNVDIREIDTNILRSKVSIVPQDPVLFSGSIRFNLDPMKKYNDDTLWMVLEKCHIKEMVKTLQKQLDQEILENGRNFSVGERQLVCLARALLRKSKVLILDEATASIDQHTNELIKQTIGELFRECTVLTIAHRLDTVLGCDKILLLDSGQVIEFDSPKVLLSNPQSKFYQMTNNMDNTRL